jgi:hypothetical protein
LHHETRLNRLPEELGPVRPGRSPDLADQQGSPNRAVQIRGDWDLGVIDADVELMTHGTVAPDGAYHIEPRTAALEARWRDMVR